MPGGKFFAQDFPKISKKNKCTRWYIVHITYIHTFENYTHRQEIKSGPLRQSFPRIHVFSNLFFIILWAPNEHFNGWQHGFGTLLVRIRIDRFNTCMQLMIITKELTLYWLVHLRRVTLEMTMLLVGNCSWNYAVWYRFDLLVPYYLSMLLRGFFSHDAAHCILVANIKAVFIT